MDRIESEMTAESGRLFIPVDLHQHGGVPDEPAREAIPDAEPDPAPAPESRHSGARLWRENGVLFYQDDGMKGPEPVRLVWARPLSGQGGPVSVMMAEKKREVAYFPDLSAFPEEFRGIAEEELDAGVVMPVIKEIYRVNPKFGNFYWDVETDKGRRTFLLLSPESNTFRPDSDTVVLRDVSGNCYEIKSISSLSLSSLREMDRVL